MKAGDMRVPGATYRLQFCRDLGFARVREIVTYLKGLGITDLYASPIFKAVRGSTHGYDVVDHGLINDELGSAEEFKALAESVRSEGLGWIQDIVPNHAAFDSGNDKLMDVLANGSASEYYNFFDIEWDHPYEAIGGRLLAPFLGQFYSQALEAGLIKLSYGRDGLSINYYQHVYPLKIETYTRVLGYTIERLKARLGENHPDFLKLLGVIYILKNLPSDDRRKDRAEQVLFIKRMLWELYTGRREVTQFVDTNIAAFNGRVGEPETFNLLDGLLSEQVFRLAFWKVGTEEINYRRFFAINGLICVRVEQASVFEKCHQLIAQLISEGIITGLRVDHIDGLWDPATYLSRLRRLAGEKYIIVEKILSMEEELRNWPVQGTTGYDFCNYVNSVFYDTRNDSRLERIYTLAAGIRAPYPVLVREKKRLIIRTHMTADIDNLALFIKRISARDRLGNDITLHGLRRGIVEVLIELGVYRTYIDYLSFADTDKAIITAAINAARKSNPELVQEFDFIERFLLLKFGPAAAAQEQSEWIRFVMRFQQFSGPLMAKGFEDTLLYAYNKLVSLNEVGSQPYHSSVTAKRFHQFNRCRARQWPATMNTTATHDTKRGEDVRMRIHVVSEMPHLWAQRVKGWYAMNRRRRITVNGAVVPDRNDEYFFYQTLLGTYPCGMVSEERYAERLKAYMIKAVREAKAHSEWFKPDEAYEQGLEVFIDAVLDRAEANAFIADFEAFVMRTAFYGMLNSLSQTVLKIASPGVPDFYQGCELWDLSMVDPDNRRQVDFATRAAMLKELKDGEAVNRGKLLDNLLFTMADGRVKLYTIMCGLRLRNMMREVFESGRYIPLRVSGKYARNILAFARVHKGRWVAAIVGRFFTGLVDTGQMPLGTVWAETAIELPGAKYPHTWINAFTDENVRYEKIIPVGQMLAKYPAGLFWGAES